MKKEILANLLKTTLLLEWYGIRIESSKEIGYTTHQYISVPESSTIETEDPELNTKIKTADGMISIAKDMLIKTLLDYCQSEFNDDEYTQEVRDNIAEYLKIYVRIRKGEVWTKEMGDARVEELSKDINKSKEYQEV